MQMWLWVSDLTKRNDWMRVRSLHHGRDQTVELGVVPGRLNPDILSWVVNATVKGAFVAMGSQMEYHFAECVPYSFSSLDQDSIQLGLSYTKLTVSYSGDP